MNLLLQTMKKTIFLFVLVVLLVSFRLVNDVFFTIPKDWPSPTYNFANNPLTKEKIQLGRALFYDPILSSDKTISCASCHLSHTAFTHVDHDLKSGA